MGEAYRGEAGLEGQRAVEVVGIWSRTTRSEAVAGSAGDQPQHTVNLSLGANSRA